MTFLLVMLNPYPRFGVSVGIHYFVSLRKKPGFFKAIFLNDLDQLVGENNLKARVNAVQWGQLVGCFTFFFHSIRWLLKKYKVVADEYGDIVQYSRHTNPNPTPILPLAQTLNLTLTLISTLGTWIAGMCGGLSICFWQRDSWRILSLYVFVRCESQS